MPVYRWISPIPRKRWLVVLVARRDIRQNQCTCRRFNPQMQFAAVATGKNMEISSTRGNGNGKGGCCYYFLSALWKPRIDEAEVKGGIELGENC